MNGRKRQIIRWFMAVMFFASWNIRAQFGFSQDRSLFSDGEKPVQISIDSQEIYVGESAVLEIQVEEGKGGQASQAPSLKGTEAFDVLELTPSRSSFSSMSIVNGNMKKETKENIRYRYQITPKRVGTVTIPPMKVSAGGRTYTTQSIPIQVREAETLDDLKLTMTVSATDCYEGESAMLTWRWEVGRPVHSFRFSIPALELDTFSYPTVETEIDSSRLQEYVAIPLANGGKLIGQRRSGSGGRVVVEFSCPIIAKKAGSFELPATSVVCEIDDETKRSSSRRHDFWDDDFGFFGTSRKTRRVSISSQAVSLTVHDLPTEGRPSSFSGIIGACEVSCTAEPQEVHVGDPIELTVTLSGPSYLDTVRLPSLSSQEPLSSQFKVSGDDEPGTVQGTVKTFKRILRANDSKVTAIPPITVSYFDSQAGQYAVASSQPIPLKVQQAMKQVTVLDAEGGTADGDEMRRKETEIKARNGGLMSNYSVEELLDNQLLERHGLVRTRGGMAVLLAFPLLYLLAGGVILYKKHADGNAELTKRRRAGARCLHGLAKAESSGAGPSEIFDCLREYLGVKFGMCGDALTYRDVHDKLVECHVDDGDIQRWKRLFEQCEASRYAGDASMTSSADILLSARELVERLEEKR